MKEEQQKYYQKEWATLRLDKKPGRTGWRTTVAAPDFVDFIKWLKDKNIQGTALDLGCGGGRHSLVFAKAGFETYGIDFADAAINMARSNAITAGVDNLTEFRVGDALELPYADDYFDVINDDGCLHHIDPQDWPAYLENITRVIKPGGIVRIKVFSKNCGYYTQHSSGKKAQWEPRQDGGYTYFFNEQDIINLFKKNYEIISLEEKAHSQAADKKFFFILLRPR